jgi:hypothetical protein
MSDTPETDAELNLYLRHGEAHQVSVPWIEFARKLERDRDEAREAAAKWESSSDAMERAGAEQARRADENREWALKAERERDEARKELEEYRSIAESIGAVKAVSEKEKAICERNEALNKMADALQEVDLRTLDYERMKQERDEALESRALRQILCDSQDEVLRLTFENRELNQGIDEALILGNKLADECERILGLGLHQNTIQRFKAALEAWKKYNNE